MAIDLSWQLRIFFSVDVQGSTSYKVQESDSTVPNWTQAFKEFFREFPQTLKQAYKDLDTPLQGLAAPPEIWKFVGDEILFWQKLERHDQSLAHVVAFKNAIMKFNDAWSSKLPLRLKGAGWLAGFPVANSEVQLSTSPDGDKEIRDFLGPSIDLGFRIAHLATERKFAVSTDLALLILDAMHSLEAQHSCILLYDGRQSLKGVLGGCPYPIVWIDMYDGQQTDEEKLLGQRREVDHDTLLSFIRRFLDSTAGMRRPFIEGDPNQKYGQVPEDLEEIRQNLIAEESTRNYTDLDDDDQPAEGTTHKPKKPRTRADDSPSP